MRKIDFVLIIFVVVVVALAIVIGLAFTNSEIGSGFLSAKPPDTSSAESGNTTSVAENSEPLVITGEPTVLGPAELSTETALDILDALFKLYPDENRDASIYVIKCYANFDGTYVVSINLDPEKREDDEVNEIFDINQSFRLDGCTFIDQDLMVYNGEAIKTLKRAYHDEWLARDEYLQIYDMYRNEYSSYYTLNHTLTEEDLGKINSAWTKQHGSVFADSLDEIGEPGQKLFYGKYGDCYVFHLRGSDTNKTYAFHVGVVVFEHCDSESEFVVFHNSQYYTLAKAYENELLTLSDLFKIRDEHDKWTGWQK